MPDGVQEKACAFSLFKDPLFHFATVKCNIRHCQTETARSHGTQVWAIGDPLLPVPATEGRDSVSLRAAQWRMNTKLADYADGRNENESL